MDGFVLNGKRLHPERLPSPAAITWVSWRAEIAEVAKRSSSNEKPRAGGPGGAGGGARGLIARGASVACGRPGGPPLCRSLKDTITSPRRGYAHPKRPRPPPVADRRADARRAWVVADRMTTQDRGSGSSSRVGAANALACNSANTPRGMRTAIIWPSGAAKRTSTVSPPSISPTPVRDFTATARGGSVSSAMGKSPDALMAGALEPLPQLLVTQAAPEMPLLTDATCVLALRSLGIARAHHTSTQSSRLPISEKCLDAM
jgi:hypothetical protein